jgi:signal transduction histidine kinase/ActR/RegA family two-component response regulator
MDGTEHIVNSELTATKHEKLTELMRMIEHGDEASRIFTAIISFAYDIPGVESVCLFIPSEKLNGAVVCVAQAGNNKSVTTESYEDFRQSLLAKNAIPRNYEVRLAHRHHYFNIISLGVLVGSLVVHADTLEEIDIEFLTGLSFHAGIVNERQKFSGTVQHLLERLQILNELNQLVVSNAGLSRIVKSIARESAFRFAADISFTFLLNEDRTILESKGGYGCNPQSIPRSVELNSNNLLAQVIRSGGILSIPNLQTQTGYGLDFASKIGVKAVDVCCLEVREEPLGAILIGFRRETVISKQDLSRFEEFCRAAGVAIANARTQEKITSYTERLEEIVEARTADLVIQTARAEEANQAKSQFLANMSHELRTPLTAIVGYSSIMSDGIFGELNDKQKDALSAVTRSSEHLKNLIDDVLNLARIESGKEEPEPTSVLVPELLTHAYKLMQKTALDKDIKLEPLSIPAEVDNVHLYSDKKHINQIVINLMSNAVKYTPAGGKVKLTVELVDDRVKINITDTGVGIPPDRLKTLFERFERGSDSYSKSQEGTGIGLNLTKKLVEINKGQVGVESEVGVGSTFWITMPIAQEEQHFVAKDKEDELQVRLDGLRVLLVDDSDETRQILSLMFGSAGAEVTDSKNIDAALTVLTEKQFDIVITDLAMPGRDGRELIHLIRDGKNETSQLPIIVLSACAFEGDRENAMNAGASSFIAKPFRPKEVLREVKKLTFSNLIKSK